MFSWYTDITYKTFSYKTFSYKTFSYKTFSYKTFSYKTFSYKTISYKTISYKKYFCYYYIDVPDIEMFKITFGTQTIHIKHLKFKTKLKL